MAEFLPFHLISTVTSCHLLSLLSLLLFCFLSFFFAKSQSLNYSGNSTKISVEFQPSDFFFPKIRPHHILLLCSISIFQFFQNLLLIFNGYNSPIRPLNSLPLTILSTYLDSDYRVTNTCRNMPQKAVKQEGTISRNGLSIDPKCDS